MPKREGIVRIGAVGDIHYTKAARAGLQDLFARASAEVDVLVLAGDLTDHGLPDEAHSLAKAIHTSSTVPVVAVLGNHDYESGKEEEVKEILTNAGIVVLDGDAREIEGVGFAGLKGFCGGFGKRALGPWGESIVKQFVREAVDEALRLEAALVRLRRSPRVAVLHYSPIQETVEGEPLEIYPFLGSSRLEEPLSRYPVDVVFHGHAHRGRHEGRTAGGVPVYNVCLHILRQLHPDRVPIKVIELPVAPAGLGSAPLGQDLVTTRA